MTPKPWPKMKDANDTSTLGIQAVTINFKITRSSI